MVTGWLEFARSKPRSSVKVPWLTVGAAPCEEIAECTVMPGGSEPVTCASGSSAGP